MTPQPGDFGVTRIGGWVGRLIRIGQWLNGDGFSDYEHAFVVMPDPDSNPEWFTNRLHPAPASAGPPFLIEAQPGGARLTVNVYPDDTTVYSSWDLSDETRHAIVMIALGLTGTPYSVLDYFSLALHRLHIRPWWLERYVASTRHMICSQLVDHVYERAGVHLFHGRSPGDVTPARLLQVLKGPQ